MTTSKSRRRREVLKPGAKPEVPGAEKGLACVNASITKRTLCVNLSTSGVVSQILEAFLPPSVDK